jgi:transposase
VPGGRKGKRGPRADNRRCLNALLWVARSGGRWRDLPKSFGKPAAAKRRYDRWIEMAFSTPSLPRWCAKPIWND